MSHLDKDNSMMKAQKAMGKKLTHKNWAYQITEKEKIFTDLILES